jgi:hypothetical protein
MFGYDPDEAPPVAAVEIRPGQLWAPRPDAVRVIGFPEAGMALGVSLRTGDWARMTAPLARSRDVFVVADPAFGYGEYPHRMVNVEMRPSGEVVEVAPGFSVPCSARQLAEGYLQAFYELVADPIGGAS